MKNNQLFFISTLLAWTLSASFGAWFLSGSHQYSFKNGFIDIAFVELTGALIITVVQCRLLDKCRYILWFFATAGALGIGSYCAAYAYILAHFPIINWHSGVFIIDWLLWPAVMFLFTAISGAPGGLIAGLLKKWAVGRGSFLRWCAASAGSWSLSFGLFGLILQIFNYPDYFYMDSLRHAPMIIKGAMIGILVGAAQGLILGSFLNRNDYFPPQAITDSSSGLS